MFRRFYEDEEYDACSDWDENGFPGEIVFGDDFYYGDYYLDERWKPIYGYIGYWVSDFGRVYGTGRGGRGMLLKPVMNADGYLKVTLCHKGYHKDKRINRLVAEAFLPKPRKDRTLVMHIDNDRTNNHVSNLAWGTYEENNRWCSICGRHRDGLNDEVREKAYEARRTPIIAINVATGQKMRFISQHEAARVLDVSQQHIWGVLNGYRRTTGGYYFEYDDLEVDYD